MRKLFLIPCLLLATVVMAQNEKNPKDLWTRTIDVSLGDNWKQKTITVPGKGTPNVIDFFRAFAKAYPCEYHNLLLMSLEGDKEVRFCGSRPYTELDKDSCCYLRNESFSMRVFYENDKPAALGVRCHKSLSDDPQDAYYFRYNPSTRKLTPMAMGSDFTGGILKRQTVFSEYKRDNYAALQHGWGRCGIQKRLVWDKGKFVVEDPIHECFQLRYTSNITEAVLDEVLFRNEMELREPQYDLDPELVGGSYLSLPVCIAIRDDKAAVGNYAAAHAMEGAYYFFARGWERTDGQMLVAVYIRCAPENDYFSHKDETGNYITTKHQLGVGDEVQLCFYYVDTKNNMVAYLDPASEAFPKMVGKNLPNLDGNKWQCEISRDHENLVFIRESDGYRKVFKWNGNLLKAQN